jgi:DNA invertase Pin-like site-specific DNA recombinase
MANALVVHKSRLPQSQKIVRAAQYVRMSTEYQKYSIENQAAMIAAYAALHALSIVRTYRDDGESGLRIKNRSGLTELIEDVQSGRTDFGHVLVFDVSRWGRFQDVDESAHYEFLCKQAGIKVVYCAEQFENDGSLISNIVKNIKRVMAAEYSRELSSKVHAGSVRLAKLGFKMGGPVGYGLQRFVVDEKCVPKGLLKAGERKFLATDRVKVRPGTVDQVKVVAWIFKQYLARKSQSEIARELNRRGAASKNGRSWTQEVIGTLLRNETYIGNLVYNRVAQKLGGKSVRNPTNVWVRSEGCVEPIISSSIFLRASKSLDEYRVQISEEEMLLRLRKVLIKKGRLSAAIIDDTPGLPSSTTYFSHFGTLRNLYRLLGYRDNHYWKEVDEYQRWANLNLKNGALLREAFEKADWPASFDRLTRYVRLSDTVNISFGVAKCHKWADRTIHWTLRRRARVPPGWLIALRLNEKNDAILDLMLLPSTSLTAKSFSISEKSRVASKIECFGTFQELVSTLARRVGNAPNQRQRSK